MTIGSPPQRPPCTIGECTRPQYHQGRCAQHWSYWSTFGVEGEK